MLMILILCMTGSADPGARVMLGHQRAIFEVTPGASSYTLTNYRNNGFQQRARERDGGWQVEIAVGNQSLDSRMKGRRVSGLPQKLADLEAKLNAAADGPFAHQVAILFDWMRRNIRYQETAQGLQGALDVLHRGSGNCVGFCNLALVVLNQMGVEARYVTGVAFRPEDRSARKLEGAVLHRWLEIKYEDVGWVFSDPAGKVNFVTATYLVLGVEGVHPIQETLTRAVGTHVALKRLQDGMRDAGRARGLDGRLRIRPNSL